MRDTQGILDLKNWEVGIPGREKTIWEGGLFKLTLTFPDEYPTKPPKCEAILRASMQPPSDMLRQIRPPVISPQRLSLGHRLFVNPERGGRLETGDHNQADPPGNPGLAKRPQP